MRKHFDINDTDRKTSIVMRNLSKQEGMREPDKDGDDYISPQVLPFVGRKGFRKELEKTLELGEEGQMVYINQTSNGTTYRMGTPTKAIIAAGVKKVLGNNTSEIVAAGIRALYGKQKYAYKYSAV